MKRDILIIAVAALFMGIGALRSQTASPAKSPAQVMEEIKTTNKDLIEQQKKTLETLEQMGKTANQIKAMGKRT